MISSRYRFIPSNYQEMDQASVNVEDSMRTVLEIFDHMKIEKFTTDQIIEIAKMILNENQRLMELGDD